MPDHLILLHGLWMRAPVMWPLASRLRRLGFEVETFGYSSLWASPEQAVAGLARRLQALAMQDPARPVHLVAHSLGGLIALGALRECDAPPPGRVVCIGSPLLGSQAARAMDHRGLGWLAGRSGALLRAGIASLPEGREVGVIAGDRPLGLGRWMARFDSANDGTVAVRETRIGGLREHVVMPLSHTGLIVDSRVAKLSADFLQTGYFRP